MASNDKKQSAEYCSWDRERVSKEQQLEDAKLKNNLIDAKIRRLETVYGYIKSEYNDFFHVKQNEKRALTSKRRWKGSLKSAYDVKVEALKTANESYYKEINRNIMDEINNKINELRKQKYSDNFIGDLQRKISDLKTKMKNWLNG